MKNDIVYATGSVLCGTSVGICIYNTLAGGPPIVSAASGAVGTLMALVGFREAALEISRTMVALEISKRPQDFVAPNTNPLPPAP